MNRWTASLTLIVVTVCSALPAHALTPAHYWSHGFGGTLGETPASVAVDAAGNVYVTGFFSGTANFGGSDLVSLGQRGQAK